MDPVSVIQWNTKSIRRKKHELLYLINKFHPSAVAVSETWLIPGSRFHVSGYSCLRDDRADGYAGSALLVSRSIPFSLITLPPISPEINVVAVKAFNITLLSVYIAHPRLSLIPDILRIISSVPSPIILMGDFNAHHCSWGSSHNDSFALVLLEILDEANLCIINNGSPTRRVLPTQNPNSAVDLTICSPSLASVLSWNILPTSFGSDHFPIVISIPNRATPARNFCPTLRFRLSIDSNWSSYSSSLDSRLESLPISSNNILDCYSKFVDAMTSSAAEHFPLKKPFNHRVSTPWWDSECTEAVKLRKAAEANYNAAMTVENFVKYKKFAAKAIRLFSKKKKEGWTRYCESLSPRTPSSLVWRQIKRYRGACNIENITANDPSSWLEAFSDKMAPPFVPYKDSFPSLPSYLPSQNNFDCPFLFTELQLALDGLVDSSPGSDGIPYSFLKNASSTTKEYYLEIVNNIFEYGLIPKPWKSQVVIPLLKPGKNPSDPNSRRPIALSSVLAKVAEHMAKHRLEWLVESRNLLAKSQFGFRKSMSTTDSLSILTTDIRTSLLRKEYLVGAFLDIASAYDNVLLPVLKNKLIRLNIPEKLVRFICNMLMERIITIKCQNVLFSPRTVWKGLPQGSVLSPLLYSLYTYDLEQTVEPMCQILQYADDLVLYVPQRSLEAAVGRLTSALEYLSHWLHHHGLGLSASKSSVVVFTTKRQVPSVIIKINNEPVPQVNTVKFLGIWLDHKLSGIPHTNYVAQKCEKNINVLRSLSGVWWGAHPCTQRLLYNAIVRSHMDYGMFLLDPCNKSGLKKIDQVQAKCLRIILGAMKSSPINAMQVECCEPPLSLRRQYLSNRFFVKLAQNSEHPLLRKLELLSFLYGALVNRPDDVVPCILRSYLQFSRLPNILHQSSLIPLYSTPYEALIHTPNVVLEFGIDKDTTEANKIFTDKVCTEYKDWLTMYTDASKHTTDSPLGAAVWIPSTRIILNYKCPSVTSVFTGEALAILEAIKFVKSHNLSKAIIFSDSKSCLQSIISNPFRTKTRFPIIFKIREHLFDCHRLGVEIVLIWIPGHAGIVGNESADSCAKNAAQTGSLDHPETYSHDICTILRPIMYEAWTKKWVVSKTLKGKFYGDIQPTIPNKPWFSKFQLADKVTTSTICRLRLNHVCTPVFLAKLRIRDNSICECGLGEGDADHIFFNCSRNQFSLYDSLPSHIPLPISLKCLLHLVFTPFIKVLCRYIKINKIKL